MPPDDSPFAVKYTLYRGADKSLARPGRKQTAATKLQIWKQLKKYSEDCQCNHVSATEMTSASDEK